MMLVKTKLGQSTIHGIGIFADQDIPKGTAVWEFTPGLDLEIPRDMLVRIPEAAREDFLKYSYISMDNGNYYILCADDARFFNHSANPNVMGGTGENGDKEIDYAVRDILKGEELTCDYRTFAAEFTEDLLKATN